MRSKKAAVAFAILVGLLAIAAPVVISLYLARQQSLDEQTTRVSLLAKDILRRASETGRQTDAAFARMGEVVAEDPCSDSAIALMNQISVAAEQLQALGYVSGNRLLCTSFGRYAGGIAVGPPNYRSARGYDFRTGVALPNVPDIKFVLLTNPSNGLTAIIHPALPLDIFVDDPTITVGIAGFSRRQPIDVRGTFDRRWLAALGNKPNIEFFDGDNVVAVRRSPTDDIAAFAAIPAVSVQAGLRHLAFILVPIGLLAGIALALVVLRVARLQLALPAVLKGALRRNEFFLEYQPVVDLRTGRWAGAEALLRWQRPSGERVRPDIFIPVAEDTGLISRITERVMEIIGQDAAGLFARHPDFHIALNLAAADLQSSRTLELLEQLAAHTRARPGNLIIEATERGLIKGDATSTRLRDIRAAGVRVAIDDFGTGYSSLSYLQTFEVDYLKIDKSFVDTIGKDAATSHVITHIIKMAKDLKLELIAEGVETEEQAQFLRDHGVEYAQGWLFAKAMPLDNVRQRLRTEAA